MCERRTEPSHRSSQTEPGELIWVAWFWVWFLLTFRTKPEPALTNRWFPAGSHPSVDPQNRQTFTGRDLRVELPGPAGSQSTEGSNEMFCATGPFLQNISRSERSVSGGTLEVCSVTTSDASETASEELRRGGGHVMYTKLLMVAFNEPEPVQNPFRFLFGSARG